MSQVAHPKMKIEFILECVEVYKSLPALRDVESKEYNNRQKK
jgi:hypothetical protein